MRLESGPAKADRNWQIVRSVLFLGFALYFVYDGAWGYPNANRKEATKQLKAWPFEGRLEYEELPEKPTKAEFQKVENVSPLSRDDLHAALGEPSVEDDKDDKEYFVSRYGYATAIIQAGLVQELTWKEWKYSYNDIVEQFYWAILPAIPGLYFLWKLYKAMTLHVVVDDEGMTYDQQRIPFDEMVALRDYNPKGWIDLYHQTDSKQKKLRLDNEKVMKFDEIVAAICAAKGFPNEVQEYYDRKAREEARKEEAAQAELEEPADESALGDEPADVSEESEERGDQK